MGKEPRAGGSEQLTPEELREDIERTREELGDTVEALAHKTDVKARAREKAEEVKQSVREKTPDSVGAAAKQARENPIPVATIGAFALGFLIGRVTSR